LVLTPKTESTKLRRETLELFLKFNKEWH